MIPYCILLVTSLFFAKKVTKSECYLVPLWLFMTLFIGLRDGVGTDYENYVDIYNSYNFYLELGFQYIVNTLNDRHLPVWSMFLSIAALTYFFIFATIYKNDNIRKYGSTLLLLLCTFSFICNGIRQALAISIFFFASRFIMNRQWYLYFIFVLLASLFHASILICLPLYFLLDRYLAKKIYVIVYIISFVFTTMDLRSLTSPFMFFIEGSDRYSSLLDSDLYSSGYFSFGILAIIINNIIILYFALKTDMEKLRPLWFNFFFISIVLMNMRVASPLFIRVQVIFGWFVYLLIPLLISSIKDKQVRNIFIAYLILTTCVSSINYILNPESKLYPYNFVSL